MVVMAKALCTVCVSLFAIPSRGRESTAFGFCSNSMLTDTEQRAYQEGTEHYFFHPLFSCLVK
jgi:hypothetical protein